VLILLSVVFLIMRVMPGDPVLAMLGPKAPPKHVEALREQLGLNKPIVIQYIEYLSGLLHGDFGRSLIWGRRPVLVEIFEHFPATVELTISSFTIAVVIGLLTGMYSAYKYERPVDYALRLYGVVTYALFIPWFGMMLQLIFGVYLGWLPIGGRIDPGMGMYIKTITGLYILDSILTGDFTVLASAIKHLILPSITLGIVLSGVYTRLTRSNMIEVLRQDFITAVRARGLPERVVLFKHALKNTFIPILTMMGLQFALLLAGAVLTETTFSWPGMGTFLMERILYRDFPTVQGIIVFFAILVAIVSLVVDILYAMLDPRVRY
ncbi:ABC transporter permease, partial [Candidatus Geothermarchaeota archaeon]